METKNSKQFSTAHPGYIAIIVDQSGSMGQPYPECGTKAKFVHRVVNRTINEIMNANGDGETIKGRVIISLFGCGGKEVTNIRTDKIDQFAASPLRVERRKQKVSDGNGGLVEIETDNPIFFEEVAKGVTPLGSALEAVKEVFKGYMENDPNSPAPVLIIISDGRPELGSDSADAEEEAKAIHEAQEIMALQGNDGSPLIFCCHIGDNAQKCEFPTSEAELADAQAKFMFQICSEVPESYKDAARKLELNLSEHSKGMVCNADPSTFIKFINFGSSAASVERSCNE